MKADTHAWTAHNAASPPPLVRPRPDGTVTALPCALIGVRVCMGPPLASQRSYPYPYPYP